MRSASTSVSGATTNPRRPARSATSVSQSRRNASFSSNPCQWVPHTAFRALPSPAPSAPSNHGGSADRTTRPWWISYPRNPIGDCTRRSTLSGRKAMSRSSTPRPATAPDSDSTSSTMRRPSIWYPPQMPRTGPPRSTRRVISSAIPVRRNHSRSCTVAFEPGSTTRSASASRDGSVAHCTLTPGSQASASTSVELEMRGRRTAATRSHCVPTGRPGLPTGASAVVPRESSASSHRASSNGTTPYVGRPVRSRSVSSPGCSSAGSPRNLLTTKPAISA